MNFIDRLRARIHYISGRKRGRTIRRKQFNLTMAEEIIVVVKIIAVVLKVPKYVACEHILEVGSYQVLQAINDPEERERLKKHLVEVHLLGNKLKEDEALSIFSINR